MNFDSTHLFTLRAPEELTKRLRLRVTQALKTKLSKNVNYPDLWKETMESNARKMKRTQYWKFRLLHSQFNGVGVLGLPTFVRAARFVIKNIGTRR